MSIVLTNTAVAETVANYDGFASLVAKWSHRTDLADMIPSFLSLAEARISNDLRLARQLTTVTLVQPANVRGVDLPDDWLEIKSIILPDAPERRLEFISQDQFDRKTLERYDQLTNRNLSFVYTLDGDRLLTGRIPKADYNITLRYYARLPSLLTTDSNWLVQYHPGVYLWAVLIEVMLYTQDNDQMMIYTQRYTTEVERLQMVENKAAHSGSTLRIRTR